MLNDENINASKLYLVSNWSDKGEKRKKVPLKLYTTETLRKEYCLKETGGEVSQEEKWKSNLLLVLYSLKGMKRLSLIRGV